MSKERVVMPLVQTSYDASKKFRDKIAQLIEVTTHNL